MKIITTLLMLALLTVSGCGTTTERQAHRERAVARDPVERSVSPLDT